jgi:hypothetical protein
MGFRNYSQQQEAILAAKVEQARRQTIADVYASRLELVQCEANNRAILEVCQRWCGYDDNVLPSRAIFDLAIAENPDELQNLATTTLQNAQQQLARQILDLLRHKNPTQWNDFTLRNEGRRLLMLDVPALRVRLADIQRSLKMATQPVSELKSLVHEATKPNYSKEPLPDHIDAAFIRRLSATEIIKLNERFGRDAVNARLAGR